MMGSGTRPLFVVFEGLDGTGKTTCARQTAQRLDAEFLSTPPAAVQEYRDRIIEAYGRCQEAAQLFYLSTVFQISEVTRALIGEGKSVVMDRYFLSTQAYAEFRGTRLDLDGIGSLLVPANLTVFLDAPVEIRRQRLQVRGWSSADRETVTPDADRQLREAYARRTGHPVVGKWLHIDTSATSPADIAKLVLQETVELALS